MSEDTVAAFVDAVRAALTDEDELAHGEAVTWHGNDPDAFVGLGRCAYCEDEWPCRTQRAIDRILERMPDTMAANDG